MTSESDVMQDFEPVVVFPLLKVSEFFSFFERNLFAK